jgi:hypothetical protein
VLSDFQRRPQEVEPTEPQDCTLAPSEAEDGTEVRHWPVLAHGVSERGELVGGDHVPDGLRDGRQPDTPARGSHNQLGRDRGVEDGPEDAVLPADSGRSGLGRPLGDQQLDVRRRD